MAAETNKIKAKLANLNTSLSEVEYLLEPILSQSLLETIFELETIQQAKLQTVLPYLVYDLVFSECTVFPSFLDAQLFTSLPESERSGS